MRPIKKGSTDQSVVIRIIDSSDGTPENAVDYDTAGIDLWYRREAATKTSITEAALATLDSAHSDGGIELIGDGYYRLDLPDAAVAAGANGVMVGGTVTGMIVVGCYVPLVDYDPYDSVRAGLTALPNAAADGAGGLPISDAGGLDLDIVLGRITGNVALASVCTEARLVELDAANLPADVASRSSHSAADVWAVGTRALTDKAGFDLSAAAVDAILDEVVEGTLTMRQLLRILLASSAGKTSGFGTGSPAFRDLADSKNRISGTVDANGNRTAVTLDGA